MASNRSLDHEAGAQREAHQKALVDFLSSDLSLAFTMLHTAEIEAELDPVHCRRILTHIRTALDTIQNLVNRVDDPVASRRTRARTGELERALDALTEKSSQL
jgi:hypothetical protein